MRIEYLIFSYLAACLASTQTTSLSKSLAWPNRFPKQLSASRRRTGLTTAEFLYHHAIVHGQKAWNAPDSIEQPLAYVQDHVFDSAYGVNTTDQGTNPQHVNYFGHSDVTELYSRSQEAFFTPPTNNYTAVVIGPDGNAFSDFSASISMYAYEQSKTVSDSCLISESSEMYNAFYFVFAEAENASDSSFDNITFASLIMQSFITSLPSRTIYSASMHTAVPGLDSRLYYGGANNPTLNAVLKFWLCDDNQAVNSFRSVQQQLIDKNGELRVNLDESFVLFTRATLIYDRSMAIPHDDERQRQALLAARYRGDLAGPPLQNR